MRGAGPSPRQSPRTHRPDPGPAVSFFWRKVKGKENKRRPQMSSPLKCHRIHRSLASQFKYALVWGTSTKYSPQRVGLTHTMEHEDIIQIVKK
ncbi:developmentally-regulated GTP-binding protein 2-like [Aotus nancymaae]|uniref:developmentally-regulated GTP-binding protein 2-like n=1 Tax=Aotus nancymaae TaxID=37293 RepID=UPI0030FF0D0A